MNDLTAGLREDEDARRLRLTQGYLLSTEAQIKTLPVGELRDLAVESHRAHTTLLLHIMNLVAVSREN